MRNFQSHTTRFNRNKWSCAVQFSLVSMKKDALQQKAMTRVKRLGLYGCTEPEVTFQPLVVLVYPDGKVYMADMEPKWVLSVPGGPHVGPKNLAIRDTLIKESVHYIEIFCSCFNYSDSKLLAGRHGVCGILANRFSDEKESTIWWRLSINTGLAGSCGKRNTST